MLSFQKIYIISWDRIFSWYSVSKYMKSQNGNPLKNNSFLDIFSVMLQDRSFKIYWQIEVFWIWTRTCLIRWRGCIFFLASGPQLSIHSTRVKKWKNSAIKSVVLHDYLKWVLKSFREILILCYLWELSIWKYFKNQWIEVFEGKLQESFIHT